MATIFRLILSCLITLWIFFGCNTADGPEHQQRLSEYYSLEKPEGMGPFPAVMLVPGCSGFDAEFQKEHFDRVQRLLVELGFVTLRVNYLAARNLGSCRTPGTGISVPDVTTENAAGDICIAAEHLRQQSFVKKEAINILGWSYGAAAGLRALVRTKNREPAQVDAVVAYFPECREATAWDSEVPVLVLVGENDNVAPLSKCEKIFGALPKRHKLTLKVYEGAHHSFDNADLPPEMLFRAGAGTIGYNEAAAKSAWMEVTNFLHK